ncbi:MAG: exo-alpha-sialidase [Bacteroidales bacterium]|nr:exo-alpha-sialidase [Bacteroidales bacterium]MCU0407687.1 exo-alpha-sialidase [Bacteroidales bacterium]
MENIFPFQEKHCHGSSIVELPNRDLLVVWFQGSGERTADDVAIMGSRLNRKTGTWDAPFIMADVPDFPDINPVVFIDPEKRLWLVWYTVIAYQWESSVLKYRISDNYMQASGAPEWKWQDVIHVRPDSSAPEGIGRNDSFVMLLERKFAEYHNHLASEGQIAAEGVSGITEEAWQNAVKHYLDIARGMNLVSNGSDTDGNGNRVRTRLGYPLMRRIGWQTRNKAIYIGNRMLLPLYSDGFDFSLVAISDNFGESWEFSEPLVGAGAVQPALALCADGSIRAYMRDNGPPPQRLMMSSSTDKGKTWSLVTDSEIPNPGTAADICLLKSGNWAIVHNDIEEGRHRLSVWLSEDEGKSWPHRKVIVNGMPGSETRAHYPAIIQDAGGIIHISFTNQVAGKPGGPAVKNIAHAWLSEDFLLGL